MFLRIAGSHQSRLILLIKKRDESGQQGIGADNGTRWQWQLLSVITAPCADAPHLIRLDLPSTSKILSDGRQESAPPATGIPGIPERSIGVKLPMLGDTHRVVGSVPRRVRGQRTTQGAQARDIRAPSAHVGVRKKQAQTSSTLCAP